MRQTLLDKGEAIVLPKGREAELAEEVSNWTTINFHLTEWTLDEIEKAIYLEHASEARPRVLERLLARKSTLQKEQDRRDVGL